MSKYKNGDWVNLEGLSIENKIKVASHVNEVSSHGGMLISDIEHFNPEFTVMHDNLWFFSEDIQSRNTNITDRIFAEVRLTPQQPDNDGWVDIKAGSSAQPTKPATPESLSVGDPVEFTMNEALWNGFIESFDGNGNAQVITTGGSELLIPAEELTLVKSEIPKGEYRVHIHPSNTPPLTAQDIIEAGLGHIGDRASTYDKPEGERSMGKTVKAFNAITSHNLTEEEGWLFMELLKQVRSLQGNFKADNYEDLSAYAGLRGECAARDRG